jgi:hypothetical protein
MKKGMNDPVQKAYNHLSARGIEVNCSIEEFKEQIEKHFEFGILGWFNYGDWEVDHIIPICKGGKNEVTNLHPLWKEENRSKPRSKYVSEAN